MHAVILILKVEHSELEISDLFKSYKVFHLQSSHVIKGKKCKHFTFFKSVSSTLTE